MCASFEKSLCRGVSWQRGAVMPAARSENRARSRELRGATNGQSGGDHAVEVCKVNRLHDVTACPELHCFSLEVSFRTSRDHDHREGSIQSTDASERVDAVGLWRRKVQEHQISTDLSDGRQRVVDTERK